MSVPVVRTGKTPSNPAFLAACIEQQYTSDEEEEEEEEQDDDVAEIESDESEDDTMSQSEDDGDDGSPPWDNKDADAQPMRDATLIAKLATTCETPRQAVCNAKNQHALPSTPLLLQQPQLRAKEIDTPATAPLEAKALVQGRRVWNGRPTAVSARGKQTGTSAAT